MTSKQADVCDEVILLVSIYLEFGQDFIINPNGGLQTAVGWDEVRQYIERFLLTNSQTLEPSGVYVLPDYIFHPNYGLGVLALVGELILPTEIANLESLCLQAVAAMTDANGNPIISNNPPPQVTVIQQQHDIYLFIRVSPYNLPPGVIAIMFQA